MAAKKKASKRISNTDRVLVELRTFGLAYPGAHLKSPWPGHLDLAVKDKTFAYLSIEGEPLAISCKLPRSAPDALGLPFTKPTAYGLGKSGWVSANFADGDAIPVEMLKEWLDESYRAQAPKKLAAQIGAPQDTTAKTPAKKTTKKTKKTKTKTKMAKKPAKKMA